MYLVHKSIVHDSVDSFPFWFSETVPLCCLELAVLLSQLQQWDSKPRPRRARCFQKAGGGLALRGSACCFHHSSSTCFCHQDGKALTDFPDLTMELAITLQSPLGWDGLGACFKPLLVVFQTAWTRLVRLAVSASAAFSQIQKVVAGWHGPPCFPWTYSWPGP